MECQYQNPKTLHYSIMNFAIIKFHLRVSHTHTHTCQFTVSIVLWIIFRTCQLRSKVVDKYGWLRCSWQCDNAGLYLQFISETSISSIRRIVNVLYVEISNRCDMTTNSICTRSFWQFSHLIGNRKPLQYLFYSAFFLRRLETCLWMHWLQFESKIIYRLILLKWFLPKYAFSEEQNYN